MKSYFWKPFIYRVVEIAFFIIIGGVLFGNVSLWAYVIVAAIYVLLVGLEWGEGIKSLRTKAKAKSLSPTKWWKATDENGYLLAETSDTSDFETLGLYANKKVKFWRLWKHVESEMEWRPADPRPVWERKR